MHHIKYTKLIEEAFMLKIFLFFVLLISCTQKPSEDVPQWYITTEENTSSQVYGYGASHNKEQATHNALSNLKERIYASVSSNIFMNDVAINGKSENEYTRTVKTQIPTIAITNYAIERVYFSNDTYYVEVVAERGTIADTVFEQIQKERTAISSLLTQYQTTQNEVHKVQIINNLKKQCDAHTETEHFYNGLGYMVPNPICPEIYKRHHNFKVENTIEIANTNPIIQEMLINIFSKKFTITQKSSNVITYKTKVQTKKTEDTFLSGVTIDIMQHNTSETYKKHCVGSSAESAEKATENAFMTCLVQSRNVVFEEFFNLK